MVDIGLSSKRSAISNEETRGASGPDDFEGVAESRTSSDLNPIVAAGFRFELVGESLSDFD